MFQILARLEHTFASYSNSCKLCEKKEKTKKFFQKFNCHISTIVKGIFFDLTWVKAVKIGLETVKLNLGCAHILVYVKKGLYLHQFCQQFFWKLKAKSKLYIKAAYKLQYTFSSLIFYIPGAFLSLTSLHKLICGALLGWFRITYKCKENFCNFTINRDHSNKK